MEKEQPKEIKVLEADHDDMMALMNRKRGINEAIRSLSEDALAATNKELDDLWNAWETEHELDLDLDLSRSVYAYDMHKRAIVKMRSTRAAIRSRVDREIRERADAITDNLAEEDKGTIPTDPPEKSNR